MRFGLSSLLAPNKEQMNLCLPKLSLLHIQKHFYRGRAREKEVRASGICSLKGKHVFPKSKLFTEAFSDLAQIWGRRQNVFLKRPFIPACASFLSQHVPVPVASADSVSLSDYLLPQGLGTCSSCAWKDSLFLIHRSSIDDYPGISHHGL